MTEPPWRRFFAHSRANSPSSFFSIHGREIHAGQSRLVRLPPAALCSRIPGQSAPYDLFRHFFFSRCGAPLTSFFPLFGIGEMFYVCLSFPISPSSRTYLFPSLIRILRFACPFLTGIIAMRRSLASLGKTPRLPISLFPPPPWCLSLSIS